MFILRAARIDELELMTDLCLRAKAVWGYDRAFMAACRAELTLRAEDLADTQAAEEDGKVIGIVQISTDGARAHLEKLFVDPARMGGGTGRMLFAWAAAEARRRGATVLVIESDPGAVPFYRRMGARTDGVAPSGSIPGRMLPRLTLCLAGEN